MSDTPPGLPQYVVAFCVSLLLWVLLTGTLDPQELAAGGAVALLVPAVAGRRLAILNGMRLTLAAPWHLLRYLAYFCVALFLANLDLARRVLSPSLPLHPGVVAVRTGLRSDLGRLLLANSITLTPGTLSVDVRDDHILVHWIDVSPGTDPEAATRRIAASFESRIEGFLR